MAYTEVTTQSWFGRLAESIKSVLIGLLLFIVSFPLLFWNEGRAVRTAKSLEEGAKAVISVSADAVNPANEHKLVHLTGTATTAETLTDPDFGVSAKAIKLVRNAEMYQWEEEKRSETRKKLGGGTETVTTYDYKKAWSSGLIDSSAFKEGGHQNPSQMPFESKTLTASKVTLGAFTLSPEQVEKIRDPEKLPVSDATAEALPKRIKARAEAGAFYLGESAASPRVGDVRVSFELVKPHTVSVVAQQLGSTFEPYRAEAGDSILLVEDGALSADAMFKSAQDENVVLTWILRVVGYFLMFFGLIMVFKPISVFGDVIPLVGSLLGAGLGLFSFVLSAALSTVTIAIAWVFYRPVLGILLLAVAGGALYWLRTHGKKKLEERGPALRPAVGRR